MEERILCNACIGPASIPCRERLFLKGASVGEAELPRVVTQTIHRIQVLRG
jgi:hypothetical protein